MNRVLIVRLGSLGDLIHTLPAVAAIRHAHPALEIDWLVDAGHADLLDLVPVISSIVRLAGRTVRSWLEVRGQLRARQYDVALDFQGLIKSAALARLSGAKRVIGFDRPSLREGAAASFYSEQVVVGEGRHVIEKNLRLAEAIGARTTTLEFPLRDVTSAAFDAVKLQRPEPFVLINGGAAWPNKRWPADRLGRIAQWLEKRHGLLSVALWGPGEEDLAAAIAETSGGSAIPAPATSLADLVAFARGARLMISGDTGPTHIAGAVGTPIVALFGPTDPKRNGPWRSEDISLSRYDRCDCHYERRCRHEAAGWCLSSITEDELRSAIDTRLGVHTGREP